MQNYNQIYTNDIAYYTYSSDDNWRNMSTERCRYWICGNIDYDIFNERYPFKQISQLLKEIKKSRRGYMGSYIRPLLFGWQHFILYEKHCFCIPELRWWESRLFFEQSAEI